MKKSLLLLFVVASCSPSEEQQPQNGSAASSQPAAPVATADSPPARLSSLIGLYEGGAGERRHQMCVVEGEGGEERFGLVVWGANLHSCSGSGSVSRTGDRLRLTMAGDAACTMEASISGNSVKLPATTPSGCAYYCGERAGLAGAELTQTGTSEADAMKAKDLVGEALCAGV